MKKLVSVSFLIFMVIGLSAQGARFGVHIDPQFNWLTPEARNVDKGDNLISINGGLIIEKYFAENYAFSTGLELGRQGGSLQFADSTTIHVYDEEVYLNPGETVNYKLQYITVPFDLKLKTNQIGYFTYYVMLGFTPQFNINAKGSSSAGTLDNDNIQKEINVFNLAYNFGGGLEYNLSEDTAILLGIVYHNGFLDVTKNSAKVYSRVLAIRLGVMF